MTALRTAAVPNGDLCICKDRPKSQCPGEWEPGCDLGANEKFAAVAPQGEPVAQVDADVHGGKKRVIFHSNSLTKM